MVCSSQEKLFSVLFIYQDAIFILEHDKQQLGRYNLNTKTTASDVL